MGKFELGFAVVAIVAAFAVGGILYAAYPESFTGVNAGNTETSTASSQYLGDVAPPTSTAGVNDTSTQSANSTAQSTTEAGTPTNNGGY